MFVHLHTHTEYSLLDGLSKIPALMDRVLELGQQAIAITDHGAMYGVIEFYKEARKRGIKPILGVEAYIAPGDRRSRDPREKNAYSHLTLLARNREGYRNLVALTSLAHLEGYYYKPRMDREILAKHGKGIIALSGCPSGEVFKALLEDRDADARATLGFYRDVFDAVGVEIQDHPGADPELRALLDKVNPALVRLAHDTGLPLVATNDLHYVAPEDAEPHDILLCIGTNATLNDAKRMRLEGGSYYLKSEEEMRALFRDLPEAVDNTAKVAEMVDLELEFGRIPFPPIDLPPGLTTDEYLAQVCHEGLKRRYGEALTDEHRQRLSYELDVIKTTGFAAYMLLVAEIVGEARRRRIPVGVRGSAAASIVLYTLGVTDIEPVGRKLIFERFLHAERKEMPDVDLDFADDRRDEMIQWAAERWGRDRVAQIVTFGTLGAKAAIRDVGRALGMPLADVDRVARLVPNVLHMTLDRALAESLELRQAYDADPYVRRLVDTAKRLEGVARHASTHAAGVIIAGVPLYDVVPLQKPSKASDDALPMVQFDMNIAQEVGLIKMDFLGLSNLTILGRAVELIKQYTGREIDLQSLPDGDGPTYDLLGRGETFGVFQLESAGMRRSIQELKPTSVAELAAMVALYRPGPMAQIPDYIAAKHGRAPIRYPHPDLADILDETYGVIVYQDQVLFIMWRFAGYTMGEADKIRKAMGKKIASVMAAEREKFIKGAEKQGYSAADASALFDLIEPHAGYSFNKCVVGDTVLTDATTGERVTVEALYREPRPFMVHALGEDGKLRPRQVTAVVANGEKPVFELRTAQGHRITATANHPFRTLNGWTNLEDLKVGDRIAAPRRLVVETAERWPRHELIALAGLLSEGNTCHPSTLYFFNNDQRIVDDFVQAASCFDDTVARVTQREGESRIVVSLNTGRDTRFPPGMRPWNATGALASAPALEQPSALGRSGIYEWAEQLGITWRRATEKQIPAAVFRLRDEDIELFLGRLWSGDGFIANATNVVPYYATSSSALAYGVQALLLRLGIVSGVHEKRCKYRGGERLGWTVHLVGDGAIDAFARRVLPHVVGRDAAVAMLMDHLATTERGRTAADTLPVEIRDWVDEERGKRHLTWSTLHAQCGVAPCEFYGRPSAYTRGFRRSTIARLGEFFESERLIAAATSDVFWDRVVAIEPRGVQPTYDLTVDTDHNFVANGLIVHNSHAVCYGTISYQTAYLKANYPAEYMTAVMMLADSHPAGLAARVGAAVAECAKLGIEVLPPDINRSASNFCIETKADGAKAIRFGLSMIKNVGEAAVQDLLRARAEGGPFTSVEDFCRRAGSKTLNKRMLESLIKAGALDSLGYSRGTLVANLDRLHSLMQREQRLRDSGQATMFDLFGDQVPVPMPALEMQEVEVPRQELLAWEKELLGVYVSEHPFRRAAAALAPHISAVISEVTAEMSGRDIIIAGLVAATRQLLTRDGRTFLAVELEDLSGSLEITVWPDVYEATRECWQVGQIVVVTAKVKARDDRLSVGVTLVRRWQEGETLEDLPIAEAVDGAPPSPPGNGGTRNGTSHPNGRPAPPPPQPAEERPPRLLQITLRETDDEAGDRRRLKELVAALRAYPGPDEVRLTLRTTHDEHRLSLGTALVTDGIEQRLAPILRDWGELEVTPLR